MSGADIVATIERSRIFFTSVRFVVEEPNQNFSLFSAALFEPAVVLFQQGRFFPIAFSTRRTLVPLWLDWIGLSSAFIHYFYHWPIPSMAIDWL